MNGISHQLVANIALACLDAKQRGILFPRWSGIEGGATLSDDFHIMWEPIDILRQEKQLVHRCYIDSGKLKDRGCVTRVLNHSLGSITFAQEYMKGDLDGYTETEFLENLGMFLGITCHHIGDLCTPVHVGHKIDYRALGFKSLRQLHSQVERDIGRFAKYAKVKLNHPGRVKLSENYYWGIAKQTYENHFLNLTSIYLSENEELLQKLASDVLTDAIKHTSDVWYTILRATNMTKRKWTREALI